MNMAKSLVLELTLTLLCIHCCQVSLGLVCQRSCSSILHQVRLIFKNVLMHAHDAHLIIYPKSVSRLSINAFIMLLSIILPFNIRYKFDNL